MAYILLGISLIMFLYAIDGWSMANTVRYMAALFSVIMAFFAGMLL